MKKCKSMSVSESDEHQRRWSDEQYGRKLADQKLNYDRSRAHLNFEITKDGKKQKIDQSVSIPAKVDKEISQRVTGRVNVKSVRCVSIIFEGSRERMLKLAFGGQQFNEFGDNGHLVCNPEFDQWAMDIHGFVCDEFGKDNIVSFIAHLDETNPHIHCVMVPITSDGRLSAKEMIGGDNITQAGNHMSGLHDRLAAVNARWGLERGDDVHVTGAKNRSLRQYHADLARKCLEQETQIEDNELTIGQQKDDIAKDEKKIKSLNTMISNLEARKSECEKEMSDIERQIQSGNGDLEDLKGRLSLKKKELGNYEKALADKNTKLEEAKAHLFGFFGRGELAEARNTISEKDKEIETLKAQLKEQQDNNAKLNDEMQRTNREKDKENARLRKNLDDAEKRHKSDADRIDSLDRKVHPERYRLSSGADLVRFFIPNRDIPSLSITTRVGEIENWTFSRSLSSEQLYRYDAGELTQEELVNELFKPEEQVCAEQAQLLCAALDAVSGGPAQVHVGTGGGGDSSQLGWRDKKNEGNRGLRKK